MKIDKVLEGSSGELLCLNGSSGGARPKILASSSDLKTFIYDQNSLDSSYKAYMVKFPSRYDPEDIAQIEYAYSLMAKASGLEMAETHLLNIKKDKYCFVTERFDRKATESFHLHSLSGLLHADHSKNFSFLMNSNGEWSLAPVYDLTFSRGPAGEHSMTVSGEGKNPSKKHIMLLAERFNVYEAEIIYEEIKSVILDWKKFAKKSKLSKSSTESIGQFLSSLSC